MRRVRLLTSLVAIVPLAVVAGSNTSSDAVQSSPIGLPAVQLIAQNACTGKAVTGLTAELSLVTAAGGAQPGPISNIAGHTHTWTTKVAPAGTYDLSLSAANFSGIGDETTGSSPIQVTVNPGPSQLVADSGLVETQIIAVSLVPLTYPPTRVSTCPPWPSPRLPCRSTTALPIRCSPIPVRSSSKPRAEAKSAQAHRPRRWSPLPG